MASSHLTRVVALLAAASLATFAWTAPAAARAASKKAFPQSSEALPVEPFAEYDGQKACGAVERVGVRAFRELVLERFPHTGDAGILRGCHVGARSEHKEGRAWDWSVNANDPAGRKAAEELIDWLLDADSEGNSNARARRLGLMYIIWDRHIWHSYRHPAAGMSMPYFGPSPHTDHVHFSFSRNGADGLTSFWSRTERPIEPLGSETAIAVREVDGVLEWYGADEGGVTATVSKFGKGGDLPLAGDWDGDGTGTPGVVRVRRGRLEWQLMPAARPGADDAVKESGESAAAAAGAGRTVAGKRSRSTTKPGGGTTGKTARKRTQRYVDTKKAALRNAARTIRFGYAGDRPVVGDWDGDGVTTVGFVRKVGKDIVWSVSNDNRLVAARFTFGRADKHDVPVAGDWDGDGRSTAGAVRKHRGELVWMLADGPTPEDFEVAAAKAFSSRVRGGSSGVPTVDNPKRASRVVFGVEGERPVVGDWDGDGVTTPGTVEPQEVFLHWHVTNDAGQTYVMFDHGLRGDRVAVGDFDGGVLTDWPAARPVERR